MAFRITLRKMVHHLAHSDYQEVIKTLNGLQSNASVLQESKKRGKPTDRAHLKSIEVTAKYLERTGVSREQLDKLSVIHVAGTKGKGSTCAFSESLLRQHGYKTGLYSSPHLVAVRERIRINGQPMSEQDFTKYFWTVYNALEKRKEHDGDMPSYFKFLTVMAFNVFLAEKVDVAIIEVGIGGEYDCTNILRHVQTVGITSLGKDHTSILGNTIEEIAWQKAGIMKPGCFAFTVPQPEAALRVLKERAAEKKCFLQMAPSITSYNWNNSLSLDLSSTSVQLLNASLALQLAQNWISQKSGDSINYLIEEGSATQMMEVPKYELGIPIAPVFPISAPVVEGLKQCKWPGRCQIIKVGSIFYFLDGAHTTESLCLCARWFEKHSKEINKSSKGKNVLVFNITGEREPKNLLLPLLNCDFTEVIFCPNMTCNKTDMTSDQMTLNVTTQQQLEKCEKNKEAWVQLEEEQVARNTPYMSSLKQNDTKMEACKRSKAKTHLFTCVSDVLTYVNDLSANNDCSCCVLVTGSLHLVGTVLSILDPELKLSSFCLLSDDKNLNNQW